MICYLVTARYQHTIRNYLRSPWARHVADRIAIVTYESLAWRRRLPAASAYIFSDIERLTPARLAVAKAAHEQLVAASVPVRLLNDPVRTRRRYDLLTMLHAHGTNRFAAYRWADAPLEALHYPVFVRGENDHNGALTPLLHDADQVNRAVRDLRRRGVAPAQLLITEFCDTADADCLYRKYAAFVIGDHVIPRHLWFGHNWMLKERELWDEHLAEEQRVYLEDNPHAATLREICARAAIDYGRVDYSVLGGGLQIWEINTNPVIMRSGYSSRNLNAHRLCADRLETAFTALDRQSASAAEPLHLRLPRRLGGALLRDRAADFFHKRRHRLLRRLLPGSPYLSDGKR